MTLLSFTIHKFSSKEDFFLSELKRDKLSNRETEINRPPLGDRGLSPFRGQGLDAGLLVTGGTGFLGSYLLRLLIQKGYNNIYALRRSSSRMDLVEDVKDKIHWIECDILDVVGLNEVIEKVDYIFHSAATVSFEPKHRKKMHQVNIEGTANVVNLALEHGIKKLIHVSSIAAIGRRKRLPKINEETKWERSEMNSEYGISKYLAEQEVWRGAAEGLPVAVINPGIILGAGFWDEGSASFFSKMWKGNPIYGRGGSGFVDVRDVASLMILMMESEVVNERFIAVGENWSYRKVFDSIADVLGKKRPSIALNPFLGGLAWRIEWLRSKLTGSAAIITKETVQNSFKTWIHENQKSIDTFDFTYTPLEKTILETGEIFKSNAQNGQKPAYLSVNQYFTHVEK